MCMSRSRRVISVAGRYDPSVQAYVQTSFTPSQHLHNVFNAVHTSLVLLNRSKSNTTENKNTVLLSRSVHFRCLSFEQSQPTRGSDGLPALVSSLNDPARNGINGFFFTLAFEHRQA
ncbi:hypothetical protein BaRGS_00028599 [Batillaria attramentaria]|uniref:Uncharacterized protein n=1 Tax=Batillaria attramentaria TaxID=370345 RepID=A0ABD0JZU7_9CAEN